MAVMANTCTAKGTPVVALGLRHCCYRCPPPPALRRISTCEIGMIGHFYAKSRRSLDVARGSSVVPSPSGWS